MYIYYKMTTTTSQNGRLGNQIIRNLATSLLAEKHDLQVTYSSAKDIEQLGIPLYCGSRVFPYTAELTDANYFSMYDCPVNSLDRNLDPNNHYFQTKEITRLLYDHLHTDAVKSEIMAKNPFKDRYGKNNDLYIHVRLADVAHFNPGIEYYKRAISFAQFDHLFISSDSPNHSIVTQIRELVPNHTLLNFDEVRAIQFASTCRYVILSHGSFSAVIGYLAYFADVYYPEYNPTQMWYGDMFSMDKWFRIVVNPSLDETQVVA